ncbi:threonine synthase [Prauserella isguenensis]|uniref:Threonine synthase n=1 Tax=Prauserella isguenensis TaxID=1470180 RepID=A0A839S3S4_9PSEU|nr:threonine synthase [Prauserella isguenensis]
MVISAGAGSLVLGCATDFAELHRAGEITRLPRLLVAQPEHCSPLVQAFASGADAVEFAERRPTVAEGTSIARPVRDREVLRAVRDSAGAMSAVPEEKLRPATLELAKTGLYTEPTSAQVVPAVEQFARDGQLSPDDTIVTILAGSGYKASTASNYWKVEAAASLARSAGLELRSGN